MQKKTLKIAKKCQIAIMQKIALFLKIAKKCGCDFPEGQTSTNKSAREVKP